MQTLDLDYDNARRAVAFSFQQRTWRSGYVANEAGTPRDANPHRFLGNVAREYWFNGWDDAALVASKIAARRRA